MHQQISKKIVIYLFFFISLATVNKINLLSLNFPLISNLDISGLNNFEEKKFKEDLNFLEKENFMITKQNIMLSLKQNILFQLK